MRRQLTLGLLILQPLLFAVASEGYGQCSPNPSGLTGLAVVSVNDTGVTFHWTSVEAGQEYDLTVTTDSSYQGTPNPGFVYYSNFITDTVASQSALQPGTKYWIFVVNDACSALDSISFTTLPWNCSAHTLQPGLISAVQTCSPVASLGMTSTSVYQQYTFLHNGQPIPGYTDLPGPPAGANPLIYPLPPGQAAAGVYQVATSFLNCPGGPVDTGNSQYWYYAGVDSLAVTGLTGTSVLFKWGTAQEGSTYLWGLTTDSLTLPDTLYSAKDTFAVAGGLIPGAKYYLFVTDSSIAGCGSLFDTLSFIAGSMAVNTCPPGAVPVPTILSSTGGYTVCGSNAILLVSSSAAGNVWFFNGAPLDSASATLTVTQGGNYSLAVINSAGCSDTSGPVVVTADPGPPTPVLTASGSTTICIGSSVTLSSSSGTGNQWYDGTSALPGMTGIEYLVSQAGQYWVQVTDAYGCFANSSVVTVQVNNDTAGESVVPTLTPAGPLALCSDTTILLIASQAVNYQWFWNGDAIPGENGDTLSVTLSGIYTVATGTAGCGTMGSLSDSVVVTYFSQLVPTIAMVSGVLVSSSATGNQWYLNDSIIQGAAHQQYTPPGPGSYTVRVETGVQAVDTSTFQIGVGGCWSQYSLPYLITDSIYNVPQVSVYPNPVADVLTLSNKLAGPVTVRIFNLMGQQVWMGQSLVGTVQVDAGRWSKGAYFVQVIDQRTEQEEKVVILRL